ncbi:alpha/beta fold hydrolase [Actinocatenispora thailandica]|nr:alpha/beta hydrolase [Actinocatenispora thailandica]
MVTFSAADGTRLAYRVLGEGDPIVCLPGGPTDSAYLGDLGGLSKYRQVIVPDLRGTGGSALPADPASYRCDRLVDDVEALRAHLGLDRIDLLGHSAGGNIAVQYLARYAERVRRFALVCPSPRAVGIDITPAMRLDLARQRSAEPWYPAAYAALRVAAEGGDADRDAIMPFFWGRWDEAARNHPANRPHTNPELVEGYRADGAFDPPATRAAIAGYDGPVLVLAGELDMNSPPAPMSEYAGLFAHPSLAVQPGAGHYPWVDDPAAFLRTLTAFLR